VRLVIVRPGHHVTYTAVSIVRRPIPPGLPRPAEGSPSRDRLNAAGMVLIRPCGQQRHGRMSGRL